MSNSAFDTNVLKWIGSAGKTVGDFLATVHIVKEAPIDEFLQDSSKQSQSNANGKVKKSVSDFASISNPYTRVFIENMNDMILIYNHKSQICIDENRIYLVSNS